MEWRDANTGRVASVSPACVTCNCFPPTNSVVYRNTHRGRQTGRQTLLVHSSIQSVTLEYNWNIYHTPRPMEITLYGGEQQQHNCPRRTRAVSCCCAPKRSFDVMPASGAAVCPCVCSKQRTSTSNFTKQQTKTQTTRRQHNKRRGKERTHWPVSGTGRGTSSAGRNSRACGMAGAVNVIFTINTNKSHDQEVNCLVVPNFVDGDETKDVEWNSSMSTV